MTTPHNMPIPDRIRVATPAPGANWAFTNADGGLLIIRAVSFLLTASAVAGNRVVGLQISIDGLPWLTTSIGQAQIASTAVPYCAFSSGASPTTALAGTVLPWRDDGVLIGRGHTLASLTTAIDAGDQYSAIVLDVLRYAPDYPYAAQPYRSGYTIDIGGS